MISDTPLASSSKRLTNHSARKTLVKKLRSNNVERSSIMNVTGHRNEQSLNDYDEGNENEQRHISNLIGSSKSVSSLSKQKPMSMNMINIVPPSEQQPSTSSGFERLGFFPKNTFNHCNVVFNVGQGESSYRPKSKSAVTSELLSTVNPIHKNKIYQPNNRRHRLRFKR
jgi:hypothetical protein